MHRIVVPLLLLGLLGAACGGPHPLSEEQLPRPSRPHAYAVSLRICRTAAEEYTLRRMARYLDARSARPRAIARAYVRRALRETDGWERYRAAGFRGCLGGIRRAIAASDGSEVTVSPSTSPV